jgi:ribosomal protein S18 acetylase RimI-like enzyme
MGGANLMVRAMRVTDLPAVVPLHLKTFSECKSALLGPRFVARFYQWFLIRDEAFALVAEEEDRVVGFTIGTRLGSGPAITKYTAPAAAQALLLRPWLLLHPEMQSGFRLKLRQMRQPAPELPSLPGGPDLPTAALVGIGVSPHCQGRGIGARLMEAFEYEAHRRCYRRACLTVRRDNTAAHRLYQAHGWEELVARPDGDLSMYVKLLPSLAEAPPASRREAVKVVHG